MLQQSGIYQERIYMGFSGYYGVGDFRKGTSKQSFREKMNISVKVCWKCGGYVSKKTVDYCEAKNQKIICWKCNNPNRRFK